MVEFIIRIFYQREMIVRKKKAKCIIQVRLCMNVRFLHHRSLHCEIPTLQGPCNVRSLRYRSLQCEIPTLQVLAMRDPYVTGPYIGRSLRYRSLQCEISTLQVHKM